MQDYGRGFTSSRGPKLNHFCAFCYLLLIITLATCNLPAAAEEDPPWPLVIEVGKDAEEADLRRDPILVAFLKELEKDSDKTLMDRFVATWPEPCDECEVIELDPWYKWRPYLLIVDESCTDYANHYFLALKEGRHFRLLMFVENSPPHFTRPIFKVVAHEGGKVLVYHQFENGSGYYEMDYYFVFDADKEAPALLDRTAIGKAFQATVPSGYTKMQGGGFDIDTLTFDCPVWKPDDHYRRPTGGNIYLRFRLEQGKLVLEEGQYEPNPNEQLGY